ncbi:MAG: hypothetical protein JWN14_4745, partial [Chthonomonadales bacterium]|nr:hypothetical protein [Chthonomonadales bacterium]
MACLKAAGLFRVDHVQEREIACGIEQYILAEALGDGLESVGFAVVQNGTEASDILTGDARGLVDDDAGDGLPMLWAHDAGLVVVDDVALSSNDRADEAEQRADRGVEVR